ncbi:hypothetical protein D770_25990 [Flammeovirgaceae bacterium 311]|nr:hypothetical protein D770_25990 [Flammeovirgaceae bacterium 311]
MSESKKTTDKETIRSWAEARNGVPAFVKGTESNDSGVLRIHFPEASSNDSQFDKISWDKFFDQFEKNNLALLYQDKKESGEKSTFYKMVSREDK